ncbi:AAA family ATPase [Acinetobacter baumannii]|uniref:AAA family ATPase n=1 Tax=Acinetobacter baumannii TaxID=470 RepID=UPI001BFEE04A|nr:ATP-binding protein [Acinetobacter baumannii]MBT8177069.1 AAA family ATPase [Acinetobacter baumannii]MDC5475261.1 AAA family ATPase [Acinetobacter baumannii]
MLSSLQVKNFRSLRNVEIPRLGLINLIVGNNNSGKSSLIESLLIFANNADEEILNTLAFAHGEPTLSDRDEEELSTPFQPFESFFSNRMFPKEDGVKIVIGELDSSNFLTIEHTFEKEVLIKYEDDEGNNLRKIKRDIISKFEIDNILEDSDLNLQINSILKIENKSFTTRISLEPDRRRNSIISRSLDAKLNIPHSYIPTSFLDPDDLALDWDKLVLTPYQDYIIEALQIIEPNLENISFIKSVNYRRNRYRSSQRTPIVKLKDHSQPFPLSSMGDGILRILQLVLKLHSARGGILLIDEFDNGLHHSVQEKVWQLVFTLAKQLKIQVFATTHSSDCVKAFSKVSKDRTDIEGILIQIGKSARKSNFGEVIANILDENQLATFIKSDFEVR